MALTISPEYALQACHIFCPRTHSETCLLPWQNSLEHLFLFGFALFCFFPISFFICIAFVLKK